MISKMGFGNGGYAARISSGKTKRGMAAAFLEKFGEFVANVMRLERSVETLKEQNKRLQEEVSRIQRKADDQAGQLKVLLTFVQISLRDQVETRAEKAEIRAVERMIAFQGNEKPED